MVIFYLLADKAVVETQSMRPGVSRTLLQLDGCAFSVIWSVCGRKFHVEWKQVHAIHHCFHRHEPHRWH
jgi:hypothetical protein